MVYFILAGVIFNVFYCLAFLLQANHYSCFICIICFEKDQSMRRRKGNRMCTRHHACKIPGMSEKSPVPKSLVTVQSNMPNRNFVVTTATLVKVTFCFRSSAISCSMLNETFDILQKILCVLDAQMLDHT